MRTLTHRAWALAMLLLVTLSGLTAKTTPPASKQLNRTVYGKLVISDEYQAGITVRGYLTVYFYSDAAMTVPVSVVNQPVSVKTNSVPCSGTATTSTANYVANGTSLSLGTAPLNTVSDNDPIHCHVWYYTLVNP